MYRVTVFYFILFQLDFISRTLSSGDFQKGQSSHPTFEQKKSPAAEEVVKRGLKASIWSRKF